MKKVALFGCVLIALLAGGLMLVNPYGALNAGPGTSFFAGSAGRAAVRSYETTTGLTDAHVAQSVGWKRCAIVDVMVDASDEVVTEEDCMEIASGVGRR